MRLFLRENEDDLFIADELNRLTRIVRELDHQKRRSRRLISKSNEAAQHRANESLVSKIRRERQKILYKARGQYSYGWTIYVDNRCPMNITHWAISDDLKKDSRRKYSIVFDKDMRRFYSHGVHNLYKWFPLQCKLVDTDGSTDIFECAVIRITWGKKRPPETRFIAVSGHTVSVRKTLESAKNGHSDRIVRHVTKKLR